MVFPVSFGASSYSGYSSPYSQFGASSGFSTLGTASGLLDALEGDQINETEVTLSSLSQLQSVSDAFQNALSELLPPYLNGSNAGNSSNPSVLSVASQGHAPTGTYNVTVNSLAQSQALQSTSYNTPDQDVVGSGNLTITLGTYDSGGNTFTPGSQAPVTVSLNNATLNDVATAINAAGGGVAAQVNAAGGGFAVVISGSNPGSANAFEIQVDNASLSPLSFDPTDQPDSGLTLTQSAQDASLSVNGAPITSTSNSGITIAPGLVVSLLESGSSTVTSSPSSAAVQSRAQSLVSAYNTVQSGLAGASTTSGADAIAGPYANALNEAANASYDNGASLLGTLTQIGLYLQGGLAAGQGTGQGTTSATSLTLDTGTLGSALAGDATGTQSLLGAAVQAFYNVADSFGGGGGVIQGAQDGFQSALYVDQLVAQQPIEPALPSIDQLASDQSSQEVLAPAQIQNAQLYARAFTPLQQNAWTSALLTEVYTPYSLATSVLSALA